MARHGAIGHSHRSESRTPGRRLAGHLLLWAGVIGLLYCSRALPAWLAPAGDSPAQPQQESAGSSQGRRAVLGGAAAATGSVMLPDEAAAFREDRIMNAKNRYSPKMRAFYQKLEGLRDDLILTVEKGGTPQEGGELIEIFARPADWYDGVDSKLRGPLVVPPSTEKGCDEAAEKFAGNGILLVPRGRCSFSKKASYTKAAGAKSMILYDQRVSRQPEETQGITGAVRSKSMATRSAGDALTGGANLQPVEKGITVMAQDPNTPGPNIAAAMIGLQNGTDLVSYIENGGKAEIVKVKRQEFFDGIDDFIKKDLKKMMREMNVFGLSMRASKDDLKDPIVKILENDQKVFKAAVESKDYAAIRKAWQQWQDHLDPIGQFDLTETI